MTSAEAWAAAKSQLTDQLGISVPATILFVDDELVTYELPDRIAIKRSDLFSVDDKRAWESFLRPRPTWLHFNLLTVEPAFSVVTVRRSQQAMDRDDERATPVNVSAERVKADLVE
jgi:hypothetical protein